MKPANIGISTQLDEIGKQMTSFIDNASNLENLCFWYHEPDPQWGGPPTVDQLMAISLQLRAAYMAMALATGLDPCEQLPSTKERFKQTPGTPTIKNYLD